MSSPQNPNPSAAQDPGMNAPQNPSMKNPNPPAVQPQNPASQQTWHGQIVYLLRRPEDQSPVRLCFNAIAAGRPGDNIGTNRWPNQLSITSGFKAMSRAMATQVYSSPLPFGQIVIDPAHAAADQKIHVVFYRVITAGYSIFYQFPADSMNPLPPAAPAGPARGLLFFSTPNAPDRILFKVFIDHHCPPVLCRGGQPAGPGLARNSGNANANGSEAVSGAGAPPALMSAGAPSRDAELPGPGGPSNAGINNVPRAGQVTGVVPGAGLVAPGAGANAGLAPTPPNASTSATVNRRRQQMANRIALARLGFTPTQFRSATPQQKAEIMQQVRRMVIDMKQRQRGQ